MVISTHLHRKQYEKILIFLFVFCRYVLVFSAGYYEVLVRQGFGLAVIGSWTEELQIADVYSNRTLNYSFLDVAYLYSNIVSQKNTLMHTELG